MTRWTTDELPRPQTDLARLTGDLDRWGYCLVAGALAEPVLSQLRERLLAQSRAELEQGVTRHDSPVELGEKKNQWVRMLSNKGRVFIDALVHNAAVLPVVRHLLGEDILLSGLDSHITWPGNGAMGLHIDQWWLPHPVAPGDRDFRRAGDVRRSRQVTGSPEPVDRLINPPVVVNVFYAATDFSPVNGGTRLVPRSHLSGCHPEPRGTYDEVQPEVPAGTAVVWDGRTWHAAGANTGNGPRIGISTYFSTPQFRQLVNFPIGTRPEVAATFSDEDRRMFGFAIWEAINNTGGAMTGFVEPGERSTGSLVP